MSLPRVKGLRMDKNNEGREPYVPVMTNASSEGAYAVEWWSRDGRTQFRLTTQVGELGFDFGARTDETGAWSTVRVGNPQRFMAEVPQSYEEFLRAAQALILEFEAI
ncbi:hypothetical protein [Lentzea sp. CC55]|uniref:hypothetical protein n=1 Tax=Lentzea sp. CC55 TaxID=2884909 RepID=UPI001F2D4836|nr:hypothetical protein [Lentzea sp. CC55]MCG8926630.1 hypothetical protein [Lentzea sp. CC55]